MEAAIFGFIAEAVIALVVADLAEQPLLKGLRDRLRGDYPQKAAFQKALENTYQKFEQRYPELTASFFDEHFLNKSEVIRELANFLIPNKSPDADTLLELWGSQFSTKPKIDSAPVKFFLDTLLDEIEAQAELKPFADSRAFEQLYAIAQSIEASVIGQQALRDLLVDIRELLRQNQLADYIPVSGTASAVLVTEADDIPGKTDKFRGRKKLIREVQKALNKDKRVLIHGFGGMGKTALAAECAADHLPLLWVKAASTDALFEALARPFNAHQAIASQTGKAKIHLMRQILAGSGIKLLLVDDVWDGTALSALTDAVPPDMKLLVTSRLTYPLKPRFNVDKLDEKEALDVLSVYAGENLKQNPDAPALCKILGYHALALKIAGSMLNVVAGLTPEELYDRIASTPHRIKMPNQYEEAGHESIEAILEVSMNALDETARQVFFAFGALFAPTATPELLALYLSPPKESKPDLPSLKEGEKPALNKLLAALQALIEPKIPDTKLVEEALTTLSLHGLADRSPATPESVVFYRIHDLSYSYARARATDEQRRRALDACLSYTERYNSPSLPNFAALRPELDNFMGAAAYAMQREEWAKAEDFAQNLYNPNEGSGFLVYQGFYTQAIALLEQAALAAEKQGNRQNQGAHLGNLSIAYDSLGDYPKAIDLYQQALAISREIGDKRGEGNRLGNLGIAYASLGDTPKAIDFFQQALAISREIGDKQGEGSDLGNLGSAYFSLGDYAKAIEYHQQALAISREIGNKSAVGSILGNLGNAYRNLGDYPKAIDLYQQALAISREIGDKRGEGSDLGNLGNAYFSLGDYPKAIDFYQQALAIARKIGNKSSEGNQLGNLGNAYRNLGDTPKAIEYHQQALAISREIGDKHGEGNQLGNLGNAYGSLGDYPKAIKYYQQARDIFVRIGANQSSSRANRPQY